MFICGASTKVAENKLPLTVSVCPAEGADWFAIYRQAAWLPIATEPGDNNFRLYGLNVRHRDDSSWFEVHYLARDEVSGDMIEPSGDIFSEWSFEDFEFWMDIQTPPSR